MDDATVRRAVITTLRHLAIRLDEAADPGAMLAALADHARGLLPFTATALALVGPWRAWRATSARPMEVSYRATLPEEAGQTLDRFLAHGGPLHVDDLLVPPWSAASHRDVLWKEGTRSALLLPLVRYDGQAMGALSFTSLQPASYPPLHHETALLLAWMMVRRLDDLPPAGGDGAAS